MKSLSSDQLLFYKIACLLVGAGCIYLGYDLFLKGFLEPGTLDIQHADTALVLRDAAPGIFFALFGSAVVGLSVFRGFYVSSETQSANQEPSQELEEFVTLCKQRGRDRIKGLFNTLEHFKQAEILSEMDYEFLRLQVAAINVDFLFASGQRQELEKLPVGGSSKHIVFGDIPNDFSRDLP